MDTNSHDSNTYCFGEYCLSGVKEQLSYKNEHIKLEPLLFNLSLLLVSNYGKVINRQQIQDAVWAGRPVSDEAIRVAIKKLRDVFDDDAKAPLFIKTLPRQGYRWLAPVNVKKSDDKKLQSKSFAIKKFIYLGVSALVTLYLGLFIFWPQFSTHTQATITTKNNPSAINVEVLTSLPGSEVYANYHLADNKLAFLHRDARNSPQPLYVKYLDSGLVKRLSWDNANYSNGAWSSDGKRLAFNRLTAKKQTLHIAEFDTSGDIYKFLTLNNPQLADKFVIEWSHDQSGLLLAQEIRPGRQHGIYQYLIENDTLSAISSPNVSGKGDYFASQSNDGSKIAILREVSKQQFSLLVLEMKTGNMLVNKVLPFLASKLTWQTNDEAIILSSFYGQSSRYVLSTDFFDDYPTLPENSLDIYNSCGERCYILRQHNGNFLDIQETPISSLLAQNDLPLLESGRLFKLPGAQDLPRYLVNREEGTNKKDKQLLYVSLVNKELFFKKLDKDNQTHTLGKLKDTFQLSALSVSKDAKNIAGVADGRLFVLETEIDSAQPIFLTNALERVDNPSWHMDSQRVYLTSLSENIPSIILYDTFTNVRVPIITGFVAFQPLPDTPKSAVGIDTKGMAWTLTETNGKWEKQHPLTQIASNNPHHWQAINNTLYFSRTLGRDAQLCMFSLNSQDPKQAPKCVSTGQNRFRLSFDIHPSEKMILLVESLGAQSNIIKMSW